MKRDLSLDEARDEQIAAFTERHYQAKRALLAQGDKDTTSAVCEALSTTISEQLWDGLVQMAVMDALSTGDALRKLVEHALRCDAEVEAIKEVEQLEQAAKEDPDNCRPRAQARLD